MRFRKLRIAWSVFWGIACVLLIVLWVRSYWWADCAHALNKDLIATNIGSNWGELYIVQIDKKLDLFVGHPPIHRWRYQLLPAFAQPNNYWAGVSRVAIPHWFLVLPTVALAAAPWLPWRFSLRTLLIAVTLVAILLGAVVYSTT